MFWVNRGFFVLLVVACCLFSVQSFCFLHCFGFIGTDSVSCLCLSLIIIIIIILIIIIIIITLESNAQSKKIKIIIIGPEQDVKRLPCPSCVCDGRLPRGAWFDQEIWRGVVAKETMSAVLKLAGVIDESASDVVVCDVVR